jgi:hypothetical protein
MNTKFHQDFIWRITGFPYEMLDQFSLVSLADKLRYLLKRNSFSSLNSFQWSVYWKEHTSNPDVEALEKEFNESFSFLRKKLIEIAQNPKFQIAVCCSSPEAATYLENLAIENINIRRSKEKRRELLAMRYLQRFTTKCETSAFFGPVAIGKFTDVRNSVQYKYSPSLYNGRTFLGDRFLENIINWIRHQPNILLKLQVRRISSIALSNNNRVIHPNLGTIQLTSYSYKLLSSASSMKTVSQLIEGSSESLNCNIETVLLLFSLGVLTDELELAWHNDNPIKAFKEILSRITDELFDIKTILNLLDEALLNWHKESGSERSKFIDQIKSNLKKITHVQQSKGGFYADHLPLNEDGFCVQTYLHLDCKWSRNFLVNLETIIKQSLFDDWQHRKAIRK